MLRQISKELKRVVGLEGIVFERPHNRVSDQSSDGSKIGHF